MKLRKGDKVMMIAGRDRHKTGEIVAVLPSRGQVVVGGLNQVKRHTKPSEKNPKGGILTQDRPIDASRVMVLDPQSGKPARIGYQTTDKGEKVRIFKVSRFTAKKLTAKAPTAPATAKASKSEVKS